MNIRQNKDYLLTTLYVFLNQFFIRIGEFHDVDEFMKIDKKEFEDNDFYELFKVVFYTYYTKFKNAVYACGENIDIYEKVLSFVKFFAELRPGGKLLVPPYLKGLRYYNLSYIPKNKRKMIVHVKEKNDPYIDPQRTLLKIGVYDAGSFMLYSLPILLQDIFGILFIKTPTNLSVWIEGGKYSFTFYPWNITEEETEALFILFKKINPKLEKLFIAGNLDPAPFIPGIRLFNELYTIKYIFLWIIENKKKTDFLKVLDDHLKMLIFTSTIERETFEFNFRNNKDFMDMTQERLNTFIKNPNATQE